MKTHLDFVVLMKILFQNTKTEVWLKINIMLLLKSLPYHSVKCVQIKASLFGLCRQINEFNLFFDSNVLTGFQDNF